MKILLPVFVLSTTIITTQAMAQQSLQVSTAENTVELNNIFDYSQFDNIQVLELSSQEMKDTQGAVLPLALIYPMLTGAAVSVGINTGISLYNNELPTWQSTAFSAGSGAIGGAYTNLMLKGAGIATSPFTSSAWQGTNSVANVTIRANGAMIGQSYSGVHKANIPLDANRPTIPTIPTYTPTTYANNLDTWKGTLPIGYYHR